MLLNLHSICQQESLGKLSFCWNCLRFCHRLWTLRNYHWPLGVTNLCSLYFWRKSLVFLEEIWWFSRTEFQPSKGSLEEKFSFGAVKIFWLTLYIWRSLRHDIVVEAAFNVPRQSFRWERFFSEKRNFCHRFCSSANNFAKWQVENGGFIKSDFFLSVVSLEKSFNF